MRRSPGYQVASLLYLCVAECEKEDLGMGGWESGSLGLWDTGSLCRVDKRTERRMTRSSGFTTLQKRLGALLPPVVRAAVFCGAIRTLLHLWGIALG